MSGCWFEGRGRRRKGGTKNKRRPMEAQCAKKEQKERKVEEGREGRDGKACAPPFSSPPPPPSIPPFLSFLPCHPGQLRALSTGGTLIWNRSKKTRKRRGFLLSSILFFLSFFFVGATFEREKNYCLGTPVDVSNPPSLAV